MRPMYALFEEIVARFAYCVRLSAVGGDPSQARSPLFLLRARVKIIQPPLGDYFIR